MNAYRTLVLFTDGLVERRGEDIDRSLNRLPDIDSKAEDDVAVLAARPQQHPGCDTGQ